MIMGSRVFWTLLSGALAGTAVWVFCPVREFCFSVGQRGWLLVDSGSLACGNGPSTKADQIKIKPRMSFHPTVPCKTSIWGSDKCFITSQKQSTGLGGLAQTSLCW